MSKVFAVSEIDAQQTIDRFVSENFPESYAIFSQYGNRSQTKTERFTTVPFMMLNGSMQWKVPLKAATMGDFLKTFEIQNHETVTVENVSYTVGDEIDCQELLKVFSEFYRECIRKWEPKGRHLDYRYFKRFILSKGVYVSDVLHGYLLKDYQVYNPRAVVSVMLRGEFRSYWSETASYDAIVPLINMNYDGLKTAIIEMLSGAEVRVNTATFKNDTVNIRSKDDVLTYMIHLGYLGYNEIRKTAFVPNEEIRQELTTAVESKTWNEMLTFQQESERLLDATLDMDGVEVAAQIEKIHNEYVSVIQYHNENSLSSVLAIAYLSAMQYYFKPIRELPTGRGFADFVFLPKPEYKNDYPALIVELKWNQKVQTAMTQIKDKKYPSSISNYTGEILLVGINYDKNSKEHQCLIEKYKKD